LGNHEEEFGKAHDISHETDQMYLQVPVLGKSLQAWEGAFKSSTLIKGGVLVGSYRRPPQFCTNDHVTVFFFNVERYNKQWCDFSEIKKNFSLRTLYII
jgi:hypothetical protein